MFSRRPGGWCCHLPVGKPHTHSYHLFCSTSDTTPQLEKHKSINSWTWNNMVLHGTGWYHIVLHGTGWYYMVLHGTTWYWFVLHCSKWYWLVLHGTESYWYYIVSSSNHWMRFFCHLSLDLLLSNKSGEDEILWLLAKHTYWTFKKNIYLYRDILILFLIP